MRFAVASDLHFEFHRDKGVALVETLPETDVIVVAGDLANAQCLWNSLVLLLGKYRHVLFVPGNHEFYGSSFQSVRQSINKLKHRMPKMRDRGETLGELHLLDHGTAVIEGQRFVGTTMWFRWQDGIALKHHYLNDFNTIRGAARRIYEENRRALEFLEETVRSTDVVVTHHPPSEGSVPPDQDEEEAKYNCFYLCDVEEFIRERQPKLWVHGHMHHSFDYLIDDTRVVCNPFGYALEEENEKFDSKLTVTLETST